MKLFRSNKKAMIFFPSCCRRTGWYYCPMIPEQFDNIKKYRDDCVNQTVEEFGNLYKSEVFAVEWAFIDKYLKRSIRKKYDENMMQFWAVKKRVWNRFDCVAYLGENIGVRFGVNSGRPFDRLSFVQY